MSSSSSISDEEFSPNYYVDAKGRPKIIFPTQGESCIPCVFNPRAKSVVIWNTYFICSCLFSFCLDSLFMFMLSAKQDKNCIAVNQTMTKVLIVMRGLTGFIHLLHILFNLTSAYYHKRTGRLMLELRYITFNYLSGYFLIDFIVVLPLPHIVMWSILQNTIGSSVSNDVIHLLQLAIIFQYMVMFYRVIVMVADKSKSEFMFESWLAKFIINLLVFFLFSHVVGCCWYFFALHRAEQCLRNACGESWCLKYIYCGQGNENGRFKDEISWKKWKDNNNATVCFTPGGFQYGIFAQAVNLMTESNIVMRYIYSLFWGFQQISTLAGNQTPAFFVWDVLFTMFITATGLLLFSLLIGNIQNFLSAR